MSAVDRSKSKDAVFEVVLEAVRRLGFDHCSYALNLSLPLTNPKVVLIDNHPSDWRKRYYEAGYLSKDPVLLQALFAALPRMHAEARSFGLCEGWAQSSRTGSGTRGVLNLSRTHEALTEQELRAKEADLRWLVNVAHLALSRVVLSRPDAWLMKPLTAREIEILRWIADGKTSREAGEILQISVDTVNFHVKNAMAKLDSVNKTSAVVKAALLGLLH
jgi:DNA-binding CsgD family transcriptional regulator